VADLILTPRPGTTEVDLAAQLQTRSILARLILVLGGRRWLRRYLDAVLNTLATLALRAAEDLDDIERDADPDVLPRPDHEQPSGVRAEPHGRPA
jgi:hypothetical protein